MITIKTDFSILGIYFLQELRRCSFSVCSEKMAMEFKANVSCGR